MGYLGPAARYRERVMGESHEATETGESIEPWVLVPSVRLAEGRLSSSSVP